MTKNDKGFGFVRKNMYICARILIITKTEKLWHNR